MSAPRPTRDSPETHHWPPPRRKRSASNQPDFLICTRPSTSSTQLLQALFTPCPGLDSYRFTALSLHALPLFHPNRSRRSAAEPPEGVWIGANDRKHENSFVWPDGQLLRYSSEPKIYILFLGLLLITRASQVKVNSLPALHVLHVLLVLWCFPCSPCSPRTSRACVR